MNVSVPVPIFFHEKKTMRMKNVFQEKMNMRYLTTLKPNMMVAGRYFSGRRRMKATAREVSTKVSRMVAQAEGNHPDPNTPKKARMQGPMEPRVKDIRSPIRNGMRSNSWSRFLKK